MVSIVRVGLVNQSLKYIAGDQYNIVHPALHIIYIQVDRDSERERLIVIINRPGARAATKKKINAS